MRALIIGLAVSAVVAVLIAGSGFIIGATEHPWHDGWKRSYNAARETPGLRRLVALVESKPDRHAGPPGLWEPARADGIDANQAAEMERLKALGYLDAYEPAHAETGVPIHVKEEVWPGLNLMHSGNKTEALLVDMEGATQHRWALPFVDAFPEREVGEWEGGQSYWRRLHLFENGDLLVIYEGLGLARIDRDSNPVWSLECGCHHDLYADEEDGSVIFVLTHDAEVDPRIHEYEPVLVDYVAVVTKEGELLREIPISDAILDSRYASLLKAGLPFGDVFHANTIEVLDGSLAGRIPAFRKGNLLISLRELDAVVVLDPDLEEIVWSMSGGWHRQHQSTMIGNGNMLVFDNRGHEGMSKIVEFDPTSQEVVWEYLGNAENDFYSRTSGSVARLPNGNTLVSESNSGRAFELTPDGLCAWEYRSGDRGGENNELVATLLEVQRIPFRFVQSWLR